MQRTFSLLAACMLLLLAACGDNPNDPTPQAVAGSYAATVFSVSQGSTIFNLLDAGAVIEMTLSPQGQTTGRFVTPAAFSESGRIEEDNLAGTWVLTGNKVRFSHAADTYLRDTEFSVEGNTLVSELRNGGTTIRTVLTRR
jgi:hypothetical protein